MSVVIVGGNECMECRYKEICKQYGHEAKVFQQCLCVEEGAGEPCRKFSAAGIGSHLKWFKNILMKQGCELNLFDIPVFVWYHYFVKKQES